MASRAPIKSTSDSSESSAEIRTVQSGRFQVSELVPPDSARSVPAPQSTVSGRFHIADIPNIPCTPASPSEVHSTAQTRRGSLNTDPLQLLTLLHHRVRALMEENRQLKEENADLKRQLAER